MPAWGPAVLGEGDPGGGAGFGEAPGAVVAVHLVRLGVVGDVDVEVAVAVEVPQDHPEAGEGAGGDTGFRADVGEGIPAVAVQPVRLRRDPHRPVEDLQALETPLPASGGRVLEIELEVVDDVEIEEPVVVEIAEGGAGTPARVAHTGGRGHLGEGAVAVVAEQLVGPPVGQIDIRVGVVVVIPDGAAHSPLRGAEAGAARNLSKAAQCLTGAGTVRCGRGGFSPPQPKPPGRLPLTASRSSQPSPS